MLENLLSNALRYVPSGGTVTLSMDARNAEPSRDGVSLPGAPAPWRLTVSDDGPGVPEDRLPFVFERFYRADQRSSARDEHNGSGLGLAIVREIVQRHGGSVRAEARAPHGLTIVVELPARRAG